MLDYGARRALLDVHALVAVGGDDVLPYDVVVALVRAVGPLRLLDLFSIDLIGRPVQIFPFLSFPYFDWL